MEYDTNKGIEPLIYNIKDDVFAIAYTGNLDDGYIATISIDLATGLIKDTVIDRAAFDEVIEVNAMGQSREFDMIHLDGEKYAIVYRNRDSDGEIRTIKIEDDGSIVADESSTVINEEKLKAGKGVICALLFCIPFWFFFIKSCIWLVQK